MLLSAEHITKTIGTRTLFADINLTLYPGDKVGLVGRNGVGKTTFMKLIAEPQGDGGKKAGAMAVRHWGNVGYLPQDPRIENGVDLTKTVTDHMLSSLNLDTDRDHLAELQSAMEADPSERAIERFTAAQEKFADRGGYTAEDKAKSFAIGIGLREERVDAPLTELSGGELRLAEIARILFGSPDALLLDEPTNHIDTDARLWLLDFMRGYRGGLIVISHDLELLDESITRVVHLDEGKTFEYKGTYSQYVRSREADLVRREKEDAQREAEMRRMKTLADKMRGQSAKRAKAAKALDQRVERLKQDAPSALAKRKEASYKFPDPPHCHRTVLMVDDLAKSYEENDVFEDLTFTFDRGQRMCLIGFNGAGKSTLLKLIARLTEPDRGKRRVRSRRIGRLLRPGARRARRGRDGDRERPQGLERILRSRDAQPARQVPADRRHRLPERSDAERWRKDQAGAGQTGRRQAQRSAARRADQQPRPRLTRLHRRSAEQLVGHDHRRQPRHRVHRRAEPGLLTGAAGG